MGGRFRGNWKLAKLRRCSQCNGKGWYFAAYPRRRVDCIRCHGTGKLDMIPTDDLESLTDRIIDPTDDELPF